MKIIGEILMSAILMLFIIWLIIQSGGEWQNVGDNWLIFGITAYRLLDFTWNKIAWK